MKVITVKPKLAKVTAADTLPVKLKVVFEPYERYSHGSRVKTATVSGPTLLDALKKMVDRMGLYFDSEEIEDEGMSAEDVINRIYSENGDGCDYILLLEDVNTGARYIEEDDLYEEEDWDD